LIRKEYYIAEFYDAPTEDISRQNSHVKVDDELDEDQQETKVCLHMMVNLFHILLWQLA